LTACLQKISLLVLDLDFLPRNRKNVAVTSEIDIVNVLEETELGIKKKQKKQAYFSSVLENKYRADHVPKASFCSFYKVKHSLSSVDLIARGEKNRVVVCYQITNKAFPQKG